MQHTRSTPKGLDGHRIQSALPRYREDLLRTLLSKPTHELGGDFEKSKEEALWKRCSQMAPTARTVKMKNRNERQRLKVVHHELDRQLARNLRCIE
ncbi:hypothetical protein TSMEX_008185 [Taenia solium]|eukprot:TsM_001054600 transcript=TsM_001054600 gene=TsM_001054600